MGSSQSQSQSRQPSAPATAAASGVPDFPFEVQLKMRIRSTAVRGDSAVFALQDRSLVAFMRDGAELWVAARKASAPDDAALPDRARNPNWIVLRAPLPVNTWSHLRLFIDGRLASPTAMLALYRDGQLVDAEVTYYALNTMDPITFGPTAGPAGLAVGRLTPGTDAPGATGTAPNWVVGELSDMPAFLGDIEAFRVAPA